MCGQFWIEREKFSRQSVNDSRSQGSVNIVIGLITLVSRPCRTCIVNHTSRDLVPDGIAREDSLFQNRFFIVARGRTPDAHHFFLSSAVSEYNRSWWSNGGLRNAGLNDGSRCFFSNTHPSVVFLFLEIVMVRRDSPVLGVEIRCEAVGAVKNLFLQDFESHCEFSEKRVERFQPINFRERQC